MNVYNSKGASVDLRAVLRFQTQKQSLFFSFYQVSFGFSFQSILILYCNCLKQRGYGHYLQNALPFEFQLFVQPEIQIRINIVPSLIGLPTFSLENLF